MEAYETYQTVRVMPETLTVKILQDEDPENPRQWDNMGTMFCLHDRYNLGDEHDLDSEQILEMVARKDVFSLPLYLYDHSGITMSTSDAGWPFNCRWDTGMVGYICVTKEAVRKEYQCERISAKRRVQALALLKSEVETYDQYLRGDVWGYVVEDEDGEHVDSCGGYFGLDYLREHLAEYYPEVEATGRCSA